MEEIALEIRLRALEREDLPQLRDWRNQDSMRLYFREYRLLNMVNQCDWFESMSRDRNTEMFGIETRTADWELIGVCGLCYINWVDRHAEVSIYIGSPDYRRQGCATETLEQLKQRAFLEFGLHRLWAEIYVYNVASVCLFEKCGFVREGIRKEHHFHDGKFHDCLLYGLVRN